MPIVVTVDRASTVPVSRQIYEFWRRGILQGRHAGGERVPSTREVAATLGLARGTITQAYEQLVSEGYLQTVHGSGTFVCRQLPEGSLPPPVAAAARGKAPMAIALSGFGQRLSQDFPYMAQRPGFINLSHWGPDLTRFPRAAWHRLYGRTLRELGPDSLDYASQAQGFEPLRREIAGYLSRSRGVVCGPDEVIVVNGSQQGLDLCARVLLEPGDEVAVENPGYLGARRVFQAHGARVRAVPVDAEGLACGELGDAARLVYVTPAHQFPTGVTLSLRRRLELIGWARERRAVVIEDDYDSEFRYGGSPLPSLQGLASDVPVIYCGTFSKVMFPAVRVGYLVVPPELVAVFTRAKWLADRHVSSYPQAALARFMGEGHLERHIRRMRRLYGMRRAALIDALDRHFGGRVQVVGDAAGMHVYVRMHDPGPAMRAERNKVQLRSVAPYFAGKAPAGEYLLGFSLLTERSIREGVRRLAL